MGEWRSMERQRERVIQLIPGIPNHISAIILSNIPYPYHPGLRAVSRSWAHFYSSKKPLIFSLRRLNPTHLILIFPQDPSLTPPFLFHPSANSISSSPLPPMPVNPHAYSLSNFSAFSSSSSPYPPHFLLLGGSLFDTRTFPLHSPSPSPSFFRFDFISSSWSPLSPMHTPRGSFALADLGPHGFLVAGGGSSHPVFSSAGTTLRSVERYDLHHDTWHPLQPLPTHRAGCVGFTVRKGREFWVMGGYTASHALHGLFPLHHYCRDALVFDLDKGSWRQIGDMWPLGERSRLGKVVVVQEEEEEEQDFPGVYMLDEDNLIFRYDMKLNRWFKESTVPRNCEDGSSFGFVALQGELFVISLMQAVELSEIRRSRQRRRGTVLYMQIYNPLKKSWRSLVTRSPFKCPIDFKTAVMCTIRV